MADVILGVGHQKSLLNVLRLAEAQLQKTRGSPRKVIVHAPGIEVQATRQRFDGEFDTFAVRLRIDGKLLESVRHIPAECSVPCSIVEDHGFHELRCHVEPASGANGGCEPIDRLAALMHLPEVWRCRGEQYRRDHLSSETLFRAMIKLRASDIHLFPGAAPVFRVDNQTRKSELCPPLSAEQILMLIQELAPEKDWKEFQEHQQCSFGYHQAGLGYARVSAFIKSAVPHCTLRYLPETIPSFEDLNIPRASMERLAKLHMGLVLVTGMTGSGKSTSVASLVDWINANKGVHILSIEDPVEYVHHSKSAVISQREVGRDVATFNEGIRAALRHDPDVIFIGEMRDPDTIRAAISAASTGHLVISTLHANTSSEVINRIVSFFDPVERDLVKLQLRDCVRCVINQRLLPRIGGGRVPAVEFLFNDTKHIADSILAGDTMAIRVGMQQTLSDSFIVEEYLLRLYKQDLITIAEAHAQAPHPEIFDQIRSGTYMIPSLESMVHHSAGH
jgi:twitching motility protein PilT